MVRETKKGLVVNPFFYAPSRFVFHQTLSKS